MKNLSSHLSVIGVEPIERQTRYRAKIDAVSPIAARTTFEQRERCFLGISLENPSFARAKLTGMVEWIARRFRHCTVLVGDSIHRITLQSVAGLPPPAARERALALGQEFLARERSVIESYAAPCEFSFLTCAEVEAWPTYASYYEALRKLLVEDAAFRSSVESFGRTYHGKHSAHLPEDVLESRVQRSTEYFLEEFSIVCSLRERHGTSVMVYPGTFSTLAEIAEGHHPGAPAELRDLVVVSLKLTAR